MNRINHALEQSEKDEFATYAFWDGAIALEKFGARPVPEMCINCEAREERLQHHYTD